MTRTTLGPRLLPVVLALAPAGAARQGPPAADKSGYHLFDPTPGELRRPLSADRPDTTESPHTVDAGALQLELSFVEYTHDDGDDGRVDSFAIAPFNLKLGLLNDVDLQAVLRPYGREGPEGGQAIDGISDLELRLKTNLWGNDAGATAFAFMPFIKLPTGSDELTNDHVEGGLIFPFATSLPGGVGLGLMGELDFVRNERNDGYDTEFLHTLVLGRSIAGDLAGYVEYVGIAPLGSGGGYRPSLSAGLTYGLGPDAQLDVGGVVGLDDDSTEDLALFAGITVRF